MSTQLLHLIKQAKHILILMHRDPDIDAIGSALAVSHMCDHLNISNIIWTAEPIKEVYQFLPSWEKVTINPTPPKDYDTVLAVDCSNKERIPAIDQINLTDHPVINIDHHPDNTEFGTLNITPTLSSTGELLYQLFNTLELPISTPIANCLYAAISFDTGRFLHSNTTHDTYQAAADLIAKGADAYPINQAIFESVSPDAFTSIKVALQNLTVDTKNRIAYTFIPKDTPLGEIKAIDFIRKIKEIDVFVVFTEQDKNEIRINLRSKTDYSVSKFANQFNGGGHHKAAGIRLEGSLEEIKTTIINALIKSL